MAFNFTEITGIRAPIVQYLSQPEVQAKMAETASDAVSAVSGALFKTRFGALALGAYTTHNLLKSAYNVTFNSGKAKTAATITVSVAVAIIAERNITDHNLGQSFAQGLLLGLLPNVLGGLVNGARSLFPAVKPKVETKEVDTQTESSFPVNKYDLEASLVND